MTINSNKLRAIIEEELSDVLDKKRRFKEKKQPNNGKKLTVVKKRNNKETDTERKRRLFNHDDLDKLSKGILETEEEEDIEELNKNHDADGRFSNEKSATCKSSYFVDRSRKPKKGSLSDKSQAGRGTKKTGQGRYRCKDNSLKWENKYRVFVENAEKYDSPHDETVIAPQDTYECSKKLQQQKVLLRKMKKLVSDAKRKGMSNCPLSYQDAVKIINQLEKASKGKAFEPDE